MHIKIPFHIPLKMRRIICQPCEILADVQRCINVRKIQNPRNPRTESLFGYSSPLDFSSFDLVLLRE